jgi:hypothetical protein
MRTITLGDFLTDDEIAKAVRLGDHAKILDQIVAPNMERINAALGQENDARYLAYAIEYAVTHGRGSP